MNFEEIPWIIQAVTDGKSAFKKILGQFCTILYMHSLFYFKERKRENLFRHENIRHGERAKKKEKVRYGKYTEK